MLEPNVRPNHVPFLGALCACSLTGLDVEALQIFNAMEKDYGAFKTDLTTMLFWSICLGGKRLEEAMELIDSLKQIRACWNAGALLG